MIIEIYENRELKVIEVMEIMRMLLYCYLFFLVDCVIDYEEGKWLCVVKNISVNEFCFMGYFLDRFVFFGVLILEVMV